MQPVTGPLHGYTVVELSTGIAGAYCTKLLADGGAQVVKVEPPQGDPLRSWSASGRRIEPGSDGALFGFLACSKHSVVADPVSDGDVDFVNDLLAGGRRGGVVARFGGRRVRCVHAHGAASLASAPDRDRRSPRSGWKARGGIGPRPSSPCRPGPAESSGLVADCLTAHRYSSAGRSANTSPALTPARRPWRHEVRGGGELLDLSMLEAQILGLTYYPVSYFQMLGRPWRDARKITVPGIARAKDGLVDVGCGTAQQWFDLCAMTGHQDWIDEDSPLSITELANEKAEEIYAWVRSQTVQEIRDLATAFRIPNAPVANGANIADLDHFQQRQSFIANPRDGFRQPGHPYRMQPALLRPPQPAPRLGEHTALYWQSRPSIRQPSKRDNVSDGLPFKGLRVLDMTTFWAGPSCTHFLAMLGAEVIHVESTRKPDGTRLIAGVPVTEDNWWEKSPIYSALNTNKKGLTLDLQTAAGRDLLRRFIATSDVIVENFTPRVLDQIGLDFTAVQALRSDAILLRMPGFGLDGPWRDNPAFAYVIEAAAGLSWLTGYPDRNPYEPYSIGDPNAGVHAVNALLLALEFRRRTGQGALIEAAMIDAALNIAAEQVIEYSAYGALLQRAGNRGPTAAPQNLYRTADIDEFGRLDSWVAVAVANDEQWAGLCEALGRPAWATDSALSDAVGRREQHDLIDEHLAAWCQDRGGDEIVRCLWDAGVPVAKVLQPHRQTDIPQLQFRRFFEDVGHPVNDEVPHSTVPVRFSAGPDRFHLRPAPLLGQHNHELLAEIGLTESEIAELEADGVIGRVPGGARTAAGR